MHELAALDATAQAALVRRGELSARELVEAAIGRIERHDAELGSVVYRLFDGARAAVDRAPAGRFHGVPTLLKDLGVFSAGDPFSNGMRFLASRGLRFPLDSAITRRLRGAGFVLVGRTNAPELGVLPTTEPAAWPPTRNPYDLTRTAGGSSGGSAAAVAAGLVPIAHGNDGGGSIRIPASCCGLVGLKPTRARVSMAPLGDPTGGLVIDGGLARSVRDAAAWLDLLQGAEPGDPFVAIPPARPYLDEVDAPTGRLRIGMATRAMRTDGVVREAHPDCVAAVEDAATLLSALGHHVDVAPIAALERAEYVERFIVLWQVGIATGLDAIAGVLGATIGEADVEPLTWTLYRRGKATSAPDHLNALAWLQTNAREVAGWWQGHDLYLTPTLAEPPPPLGTFAAPAGDPFAALVRAGEFAPFTPAWNVTGQPAISLPLHRNADGLPIGVQLVAATGREDLLIRIASQLEQARPFEHAATRR
jgi:amidase